MKYSIAKTAIAVLCVAALPLSAVAERGGNGKGNGQNADRDRGNSSTAHTNRDTRGNGNGNRNDGTLNANNGNSANARANPSQGFCAPGLRRQADGCVPPGQAAAGVTATEWAEQRGYRYVAGAQLDPSEYTLLPNYADYDLPELPAGESYAVINRTAVVIDSTTGTLLRVATR